MVPHRDRAVHRHARPVPVRGLLAVKPEPVASWWIGLDREHLDAEAKTRAERHLFKSIGPLDTIGQRLRDTWE